MISYNDNCDEMSKYEVSIRSKMVWVRASIISDKSSMRDTVIAAIAMKCPNMKYFVQRGLNMCHIFHFE